LKYATVGCCSRWAALATCCPRWRPLPACLRLLRLRRAWPAATLLSRCRCRACARTRPLPLAAGPRWRLRCWACAAPLGRATVAPRWAGAAPPLPSRALGCEACFGFFIS